MKSKLHSESGYLSEYCFYNESRYTAYRQLGYNPMNMTEQEYSKASKELDDIYIAENQEQINEKLKRWNQESKLAPRAGDFLLLPNGTYFRFTVVIQYKDQIHLQASHGGSFYFSYGYMDMSGTCGDKIDIESIELTDEEKLGSCWIFDREVARAHNGVHLKVPCRVWKQKG